MVTGSLAPSLSATTASSKNSYWKVPGHSRGRPTQTTLRSEAESFEIYLCSQHIPQPGELGNASGNRVLLLPQFILFISHQKSRVP